MLLVKLLPYCQQSDFYDLLEVELSTANSCIEREPDGVSVREEIVAAYVRDMVVLGETHKARLWVIIAVEHERMYEVLEDISRPIENVLAALVFADSYAEADVLLKTHPLVQPEIKKQPACSAFSFIFGDMGVVFSQLVGDLVEVPEIHANRIRNLIEHERI